MNKDLSVAIGVFLACVIILIVAFTEPEPANVLDEDPNAIAAIDNEIPSTDADDTPIVESDFITETDPDDSIESLIADNSDTDINSMGGSLDDIDRQLDETTDTILDDDSDTTVVDTTDTMIDDSEGAITVVDFSGDTTDDVSTDDVAVVSDTDFTEDTSTPLGSGEDKIHTVGKGEVLGTISQKYYGSAAYWRKIRDANNVYAEELQIGQRLIIPGLAESERVRGPNTTSVSGSDSTTVALEAGQRSYTVKRGDNYYLIAQRELGDASRYKELEQLNGIDAYELDVGDVIVLPATGRVRAVRTPDQAPISGAGVHVVKSGETLGDISQQHYGTSTKWQLIGEANGNLDPLKLKVGQRLQIPPVAGSTRRVERVTSRSSASGRTYVIKAQDTLSEIAQRELGSATKWRQIQAANPGLNPNRLTVGKKIIIPGAASSSSDSSSTPRSTDTVIDFSQ